MKYYEYDVPDRESFRFSFGVSKATISLKLFISCPIVTIGIEWTLYTGRLLDSLLDIKLIYSSAADNSNPAIRFPCTGAIGFNGWYNC